MWSSSPEDTMRMKPAVHKGKSSEEEESAYYKNSVAFVFE